MRAFFIPGGTTPTNNQRIRSACIYENPTHLVL
jgi:hypothetical protein